MTGSEDPRVVESLNIVDDRLFAVIKTLSVINEDLYKNLSALEMFKPLWFVLKHTGISKSTFYYFIKKSTFYYFIKRGKKSAKKTVEEFITGLDKSHITVDGRDISEWDLGIQIMLDSRNIPFKEKVIMKWVTFFLYMHMHEMEVIMGQKQTYYHWLMKNIKSAISVKPLPRKGVMKNIRTSQRGNLAMSDRVTLSIPTANIDKARSKRAFMPNLVHSLDASNVHIFFNALIKNTMPIYTIHDCFATTPTNVPSLNTMVKKPFIEIDFKDIGYLESMHRHFMEDIESHTEVYDSLYPEQTVTNVLGTEKTEANNK